MEAWRAALAGPPRTFELDREVYELTGPWSCLLEHLPTAGWHTGVLYALLDVEDADALDDRLEDDEDPLMLWDVQRVAERVVEQATGRRWWVAQRLYGTLAVEWAGLDGLLALRGVDLQGLLDRPAKVCNVVHAWLVQGADEQGRERFDAQLETPPPGVDLETSPLWTPEEEGSSFLAALSTSGGRIGGSRVGSA